MGRRKIEDIHPSLVEDVLADQLTTHEMAVKYDCTPPTIRNAASRIREAEALGVLGLDTTPVVVVFRMHASEGEVTIDTLNSYGGLRVFNRGAVDPRATMGRDEPLPHFDTLAAAGLYLGEELGAFRPCTLSYTEARRAFQGADFADFRVVDDSPL